jgi:ankyrin repeat protein
LIDAGLARILVLIVGACLLTGCQPRAPETPAAQMVRDNDTAQLSGYLSGGGDPDALASEGVPLLYLASGPRGGLDVLLALLDAGARVDATNPKGRTALMNAAGWCDARMVSALLDAGANASLADEDGKTARDSVCHGPLDRRAEVLNILDAAR